MIDHSKEKKIDFISHPIPEDLPDVRREENAVKSRRVSCDTRSLCLRLSLLRKPRLPVSLRMILLTRSHRLRKKISERVNSKHRVILLFPRVRDISEEATNVKISAEIRSYDANV